MWVTKPEFSWMHKIETLHQTTLRTHDGSTPTDEHTQFMFKSDQGDTWTGSFFAGAGYVNRSFGWEDQGGVKEFYNESYGYGDLSDFGVTMTLFGVPLPEVRTSTNVTNAHCDTVTQTAPWHQPWVTRVGVVVQDTWGWSGWNTNPLAGSPSHSRARTNARMSCEQMQYL